jgi:hypothetical protein
VTVVGLVWSGKVAKLAEISEMGKIRAASLRSAAILTGPGLWRWLVWFGVEKWQNWPKLAKWEKFARADPARDPT